MRTRRDTRSEWRGDTSGIPSHHEAFFRTRDARFRGSGGRKRSIGSRRVRPADRRDGGSRDHGDRPCRLQPPREPATGLPNVDGRQRTRNQPLTRPGFLSHGRGRLRRPRAVHPAKGIEKSGDRPYVPVRPARCRVRRSGCRAALYFAQPVFSVAVMSKSHVHSAIARMSHAERNMEYRSAIDDGDTRRADEIASAPIPDDWAEHERAVWLARRAIARNRGPGRDSPLAGPR